YLLRLIENLRQRGYFVVGRKRVWFRLRKMQARLLFDSIAQGDISRQGDHRHAAPRERGLHGNLENTGHLLRLRNQFAVVATLLENKFGVRLLKIPAADFAAWNLRRDCENGNTAMATV